MPTVLTYGPFRFYFYAGDRSEPPHVHVERDNFVAKFWLDPVVVARAAASIPKNSVDWPLSSRSIKRNYWGME